MSSSRHRTVPAATVLAPVALSALVLALYLPTLYPDVLGNGDSAKFQYLGRVLGTAHPPGYPLYVFVSHVFSYVPLGTLAWRLNLLSALASLGAVLCVYAAARTLHASVLQATLVAAALATGRIFWEKSLAAEVYSLNALLLSLALWRVLAWSESRRDRDLLTAVALLSFGLGNHLTIATVAPAFVVFVLATDVRQAQRGRIVLATLALIVAGLSQYLFIILRTRQGSPYVEAHAMNLSELVDVVRARKYSADIGAYSWGSLIRERLPEIGRLLLTEVSVGAAIMVAGVVAGFRRQWRETVLLLGSAGGILLLTAEVRADTDGFIMAALPPLWLLCALVPGLSGGRARFARLSPAVVAIATLAGLVVVHAPQNFRVNDHSARTFERRFYTALLDNLPDRGRVVVESYSQDAPLKYFLYGEGAAARDLALIGRDAEQVDQAFRVEGRAIMALDEGARALERFGFEFAPVPLQDWPVPRLIASERRGFVVAAVQPEAIPLLAREAPALMPAIGGTWKPGHEAARYAVVGTIRGGAGAHEVVTNSDAVLDLQAGADVGGLRLPVAVHVQVAPGSISISVNGETALRTTAPLAFAILGEHGQVRAKLIPEAGTLRPPIEGVSVWRLVASTRCVGIGDRTWHDASSLATSQLVIRVDDYRPYNSRTIVYLSADVPLTPHILRTLGPRPTVDVAVIAPADRPRRLAADGVAASELLLRAPQLVRIAQQVNDNGDDATSVYDLDGVPRAIVAYGEADRIAAPRVQVCSRVEAGGAGSDARGRP